MKVFKKWLIYGVINGKARLTGNGFNTKKAAIEALSMAGFEKMSENMWCDSLGRGFYIEKNTKE